MKKGTLRGYIEDGEKEITTWISIENEMVTSINSFIFQVPTYENIQALEDCELFGTSFTDLENLYLLYPYYNLVGRKVAEIYYTMAENRAALVRYRSAEKKFEFFLQYYGHLSGRVSLKYIASFLGITLETLSRVRTKYYASK